MTQGIESSSLAADPSVDPIVLVVMLIAFLIGAVGPFALCVIGSIRDERAMRRYAAAAEPIAIAVPDAVTVVPSALSLQTAAPDPDTIDPANDDAAPLLAVRS